MKVAGRRRVLIVTSSYAPAMIADMHRARHLAWELPELGWDVEILTADRSYQQTSCLDGDSSEFFAPSTPIHAAPAFLPRVFKVIGLGSIGWRVFRPIRRLGDTLLASGQFDLVLFSTTQFALFLLGPRWQSKYGVPYVLDFHDPCYREEATPPVWAKRSLKHEISRRVSRYVEARAVKSAVGLVAVSPKYIETIKGRYAGRSMKWLAPGRCEAIPFGVQERDFQGVERSPREAIDALAEAVRIVYVGAGGPIMKRAISAFCKALARLSEREPEVLKGVRVELYGTMLGWQEGDGRYLAELAAGYGCSDLVSEDPRRVTYRRAIELLVGADGAMILGVDEAAYMPSKLFTFAYSGKPILAVVRRDGPAFEAMREMALQRSVIWMDAEQEMPADDAADVLREFLASARRREQLDRRRALEPCTAAAMALHHRDLFENCLRGMRE